jgi:hypothetical protein
VQQDSTNNYLQSRLNDLGISTEFNSTTCLKFNENTETYQEATILDKDADGEPLQWFSADSNGNIKILFKKLNGKQLELKGTKKWATPFYRVRFSPNQLKKRIELYNRDNKYSQPEKTGTVIYHTQSIVDTYNAGTEVPTLYLVEGEFKAFAAYMHSLDVKLTAKHKKHKALMYPKAGMPIMGITGIWNFKNDDKNDIHPDIRDYCQRCKVKNIILLYDADLHAINGYDPEEEEQTKDLNQRLKQFYLAARDFREYTKNLVQDVYLAHIAEEHGQDGYKGLDDLLTGYRDVSNQIIIELVKLAQQGTRSRFFNNINLTSARRLEIRKFFLQKVNDFYYHHMHVLEGHTFKYNGALWFGNPDTGKPEMQRHEASYQYARIGCDYVKMIIKPDAYEQMVREIKNWKKSALVDDYVNKGYKNFIDTIPKYDDFVNIPINDPEEYKRDIVISDTSKFFNLYEPLDHQLEPGSWDNTKNYLTHIFGEQLEYILDYQYLVYTRPQTQLPIIALVSKEGGTGKTTYIEWQTALYQNNAVKIGNQELVDRFNDDYISKLVIGVDEGLIDKEPTIEKIKSWATSKKVQMDKKNSSRTRVDFFAKIIMTSNNVDNFIRISKHEERFWVRQVHRYEGKEDPFLLDKMIEEIPAFLHYLKFSHQLKVKEKQGRFWFNTKDLETEALRKLKNRSQSQLIRNVEIWIKDEFYTYNCEPTQQDDFYTLYYSIKEIREAIEKFSKADNAYIIQELKEMGIEAPTKATRCTCPKLDTMTDTKRYVKESVVKRAFTFHIADFLSKEEIENIKLDAEPATDSKLPF